MHSDYGDWLFTFLDFEKLEKSNGLRSETAQGALSPPLELVCVEDAVRDLPRPLLSSCVHPQLLSALFPRICSCYFLHSTALGLLEPVTEWYGSKKEQHLCPKLDKLCGAVCTPSACPDQAEDGILPAVIPCMTSSPSTCCFSSSLPVSPGSTCLMNHLHMNPHLRICF